MSTSVSSWFQSDECLDFYRTLSFVEAFECHIERDGKVKGRIVGYVQRDGGPIKRFLSRRAVINGGPMLAEDITEDEFTKLLDECRSLLRGKAIYCETRNFNDYGRYESAFLRNGWQYEAHYNFHVDTSSVEAVESKLGKSRKRDIRTSLREGAEFGEARNEQEVSDLYALLVNLYRTKVRTPLFPYEFFLKLYRSSWGRIFVVRYRNRVVGGTVCVCGGDVVYEWFACGEDGGIRNVYPSTLATYAGIMYAAENGYRRFDMMGAGAPGDGGYGVRDFKAKFGGELVEHGRFRYIGNRLLYKAGVMGVKFLKRH